MAKNKRRENKAEKQEINKVETPKENTEQVVEAAEDVAEEAMEKAAEAAEMEKATEETESEEAAEETEAEEESEEADEETEAEEESEEAAEETEAEEESEEAAEETEAEEESEEADEETEAEEESEEVAEETEAEEESEEADEETEAEEESEEAAEETEAEEESEEAAEETEAEEESEEAAEETEAEEESEEAAEETEVEEESEEVAEETEVEEESEEADGETEAEEESEEVAEETEVEEESEEADGETEAEEESEEAAEDFDDDDYLDYDEDETRPKKIVSGKTATVTMLITFCVSILVVVGAFLFGSKFQRSMNVGIVSYTDRFNSCRTNDFSYGSMLGIDTVSYSDEECTFTDKDIKDLKSGKTVTKFDGMVNIAANVRFGKLVSMDITFNSKIDDTENPSGYYTLLAGNAISGLVPDIDTSDYGFMLAYTVLSYSVPVEGREDVYMYQVDDMNFYVDYSKAMDTQSVKDISIHVESAKPHYIDTSSIDTSWLPWNKESDSNVSGSDASHNVSASDN